MAAILNRQHLIALEEEVSYGARPATPLNGNEFYISPTSGQVTETPSIVKMETSSGTRGPRRKVVVGKTVDWSIETEIHPINIGWLLKWTFGNMVVLSSTAGTYRVTTTGVNVEPRSFSMYIDPQKEDFWAAGEQTALLLGCKVGRLRLEADGGADDRRVVLTAEGTGQQVLSDSGGTIVVVDYTDLEDKNIYITVNGVRTTCAENDSPTGSQWNAVTDNDTTATNITTALNAVTGVTASASTATVTITAQQGYNITAIETDADPTDLTVARTSTDLLMGLAPLRYSRKLLYNSVVATPYLFQNAITQIAGGGYLASNNWRRFAIEIENTYLPQTYAKGNDSLYIDDLLLGTQMVRCEFDKNYVDAVSRINDFRNATDRAIDILLQHKDDRLSDNANYQLEFGFPRFNIDDSNPLLSFGGGDEQVVQTLSGEALLGNQSTDVTNTATGTDHTLVVATAYVAGASGDAEANTFTSGSGGYLTGLRLKMKTDSSGCTEDLYAAIYDDSSDPNALVVGAVSDKISGEMLSETMQSVYFKFPNHPKLEASTTYWILVYSTGSGTGTVIVDGDTGGTNTHTASTDGGQTWAVQDNDDWDYQIYVDEIAVYADLYIENNATTAFPDAT